MIRMDYSDWCYEYERCFDIYSEYGIDYYFSAMEVLKKMYPDYFTVWLDDVTEFDSEGAIDEISTK